MSSSDDFFNLDLLNKEVEDKVENELNSLNDAVCSITKGNAKVTITALIEDAVKAYFGDKHHDENYYVNISYTNKENQKITNKFCVISYSETYPVIVLSLKNEDGIQEFSNKYDFHKYLKKICNEKSVISSLRLSMMKKKEHFQEYKPFFCSHKEQFGCLARRRDNDCSECKYRNYRVF